MVTEGQGGCEIFNQCVKIKQANTPDPDNDYGAFYTKSDRKLYFQDGEGKEHQLSTAKIGMVIAIELGLEGSVSIEDMRNDGWAVCDGTTAISQGIIDPVITGVLPNQSNFPLYIGTSFIKVK